MHLAPVLSNIVVSRFKAQQQTNFDHDFTEMTKYQADRHNDQAKVLQCRVLYNTDKVTKFLTFYTKTSIKLKLRFVICIFCLQKLKIKLVKGDLFSCPKTDSLAHCVSKDLAMGKGIAKLFKDKFNGVPQLKLQGMYMYKYILKNGTFLSVCNFSD